MNKEKLIEMGLTEEQAKNVMDSLNGEFVTKSRFNEVNEENKALKKSVSERDKELDTLKASAGDNEKLTQQIAELQKANAEQIKAHNAELTQLKLNNAIDVALGSASVKSNKAVRAMLDMSKVQLGEDGKLVGLNDQLEALKASDGYLFNENKFAGFQPGGDGKVPGISSRWEARLADARKNNNQLEAIKIKQEAAAEGVVLI